MSTKVAIIYYVATVYKIATIYKVATLSNIVIIYEVTAIGNRASIYLVSHDTSYDIRPIDIYLLTPMYYYSRSCPGGLFITVPSACFVSASFYFPF